MIDIKSKCRGGDNLKTKEFYPLTDDLCFKKVFSQKLVAKDFLNAFFEYIGEDKKVVHFEIITNKEMIASGRNKKVFYGDIIIVLDSGEAISIEIYNRFKEREFNKSLSYLTRIFSEQLGRGAKYEDIKKMICINIVKNNSVIENDNLINRYSLINKEDDTAYGNMMVENFVINLDILKKIIYNEHKRLIKWLNIINAEEHMEIKREVEGDEIMEQTLEFMESFINDEQIREQYDKINDVEYYAKQEGKKENSFEVARNLLKTDLKIDEIAKATGLTKEEIEALK